MNSAVVRGKILIVDDEPRILKTLSRALREEGHEVRVTTSPGEAFRIVTDGSIDLLVLDNRMPELSGLDLIRQLSNGISMGELPQIVMMTAHATVESAIEAMKLGAFDYLQKPFEIDELLVVAGKALEHQRLRSEHRYLLSERRTEFNDYGIVGKSAVMREIIGKLEQVARSKSTVLIIGETGTGKELAARAIHDRSGQREMPLIKVNCAAIPESLLESELFGHVKGAFTNATTNKRGKFSLAHGSTILLDEIGMMSQPLQAKILRVLQEREFEPLGAERTEKVDVRIIAATNRDLKAMMARGDFLEDLYFRLSVIPIEIPPLRSRREDIPGLVAHFVEKHRLRMGKPVDGVSEEALEALCRYDWPGNVRELENAVERAVVLTRARVIGLDDVSFTPVERTREGSLPSHDLRENVEWAERESIRLALERAKGVKKKAAESLGLSQRALSYYLKKFDID